MGDLPRFFLPGDPLIGNLVLEGEEARHARQVLRLMPGDRLLVCDGQGREALCRLTNLSREALMASVESVTELAPEWPVKLCFYPSVSKGERFPWMLQKLCELGACEITPVYSDRCVVRDHTEQKSQRFRRILWEAAKQCGRAFLPVLHEPEPLDSLLCRPFEGVTLFCHESATCSLSAALGEYGPFRQAHVFTGPEGGYSPAEAEQARVCGLECVSLGRLILRCETAPLTAAAALLYAGGYM